MAYTFYARASVSGRGYEAAAAEQGWVVYDLESGRKVSLPGGPLDHLEQNDAEELARMLNELARQGVWRVDRHV